MKVVGPILTVAVLALGGAGYAYWRSLPVVDDALPDWTGVNAATEAFVAAHEAVATLPKEIYAEEHRRELIDPAMVLPRSHRYAFAEISALKQYTDTCDANKLPEVVKGPLAKAWQWHRFLCKETASLPTDFFDKPPYMHPLGRSFVKRAVESKVPEFGVREWVERHEPWMHALEHRNETILGQAPIKALAAVAAMENLILAGPYVLIMDRESVKTGPGTYRVFDAVDWNAYVDRSPYHFKAREPNTPCLQGSAYFCWVKRPAEPHRLSLVYGAVALTAMLVLATTLMFLIVRRVIGERRDRREQVYALQTLTHELRTPATSLNLSLEALRRDYDALPEGSQSAFLRLCDEVQRLNRVIAGSVRYLRVSGASARDRFEPRAVESVNGYVDATLAAYRDQIIVEALAQDRPIVLDPHWFGICLTNLVDNALTHGRPPVVVRVTKDDRHVLFSVEDQGQMADPQLAQLTRAFARGSASKGMGLGLHIVNRTMAGLGGKLRIAKGQTTTFVLALPVSS